MSKIPVAVLGATGAVGQRFIQLLDNHPRFELVALSASDRSEGKRYSDAANWVIEGDAPDSAKDMTLHPTDPAALRQALGFAPPVVFSALPNDSALIAEPAFAQAGACVFSNASAHRLHRDVPLVITEINPERLDMVAVQRQQRGWSGAIVCNTNCTVVGPAMTLKPLHQAFGVRRVFCVSMQASSGAGYPGVPSLDLIDNVIPFIKGEEEKLEAEARKLLGVFDGDAIREPDFALSAHCNRVPVIDGHLVTMSVETERPVTPEAAAEAMRAFKCDRVAGLHTAPAAPIVLRDENNRPQTRRDRMTGDGMSVVAGRLRAEPLFGEFGVKFVTLSHNTLRGAAGGSMLNAELFFHDGPGARAV
jgi:aspartate-semialdehyde dehydrogenase